jgi:hypothetical protein
MSTKKDGIRRWHLRLEDGKLHVTHRGGDVDVSKYHGARLLVEETTVGIGGESASESLPVDSPEIITLKRQLEESQSIRQPQTPEVLRKIQRVLKVSCIGILNIIP